MPSPASVPAATGEQFELTRGSSRAVIAELAAALRVLEVDGVAVTEPYPESTLPPFGCGIVLVPWPNRVEDGVWTLDGAAQQLDLTEPDRHNALHGLLRNTPYTAVERADASITLAAAVFPQHGYPFRLDTTVTYELVDRGLRVTHSVSNRSAARAPYAVGTHPFLRVGDVPTEQLSLQVFGSTRFAVDERLNPTGEVDVAGTDYDLRDGLVLGDRFFDDAFGDVHPVDGVSARLTAPDGRCVELLQDDDWNYVQVFTTKIFPKDGGKRIAVAVEPMTAPPNAFNSGQGLRWIEPGDSWSGSWGIRYSG